MSRQVRGSGNDGAPVTFISYVVRPTWDTLTNSRVYLSDDTYHRGEKDRYVSRLKLLTYVDEK